MIAEARKGPVGLLGTRSSSNSSASSNLADGVTKVDWYHFF